MEHSPFGTVVSQPIILLKKLSDLLYCTTIPDLYLLPAMFPEMSTFIPATSPAGYKSLQ